jgi:TPP-dependent 2-oxoacid decarboxylase
MCGTGAARNDSVEETNALVAVTNLPAFVTAMGKGSLNESLSSYGGYYAGAASFPEIRQYVESSDALLYIGRYPVRIATVLNLMFTGLHFTSRISIRKSSGQLDRRLSERLIRVCQWGVYHAGQRRSCC